MHPIQVYFLYAIRPIAIGASKKRCLLKTEYQPEAIIADGIIYREDDGKNDKADTRNFHVYHSYFGVEANSHTH